MRRCLAFVIPATVILFAGCAAPCPPSESPQPRSSFFCFTNFSLFTSATNGDSVTLLSPCIDTPPWNELILSWNADCPPDSQMVFEARAFDGREWTQFYKLGIWSPTGARESVKGQRDAEGNVSTDTLLCKRLMIAVQTRVSHKTAGPPPVLRFLGVSLLNSAAAAGATARTNFAAWGKLLEVPQRSQLGHKDADGWCSPTSLSMILAYWARELHRPELDLTVPAVAAAVFDPNWPGTGNWSFNVAFAGNFPGMRAFVTRLTEFAQVEDCIAAGVPIALSVSFDLLNGREKDLGNGHLIVVVGCTSRGDAVINDPWPNPKGENSVRKIIARDRLVRAWQRSKQTVYLVYPETKNPLPALAGRGL